jgi:hypothetical protein
MGPGTGGIAPARKAPVRRTPPALRARLVRRDGPELSFTHHVGAAKRPVHEAVGPCRTPSPIPAQDLRTYPWHGCWITWPAADLRLYSPHE